MSAGRLARSPVEPMDATPSASAIQPNPQIAMKVMKIQGCAAPSRPSSLMYWRTAE
jgi:hypothetical protein